MDFFGKRIKNKLLNNSMEHFESVFTLAVIVVIALLGILLAANLSQGFIDDADYSVVIYFVLVMLSVYTIRLSYHKKKQVSRLTRFAFYDSLSKMPNERMLKEHIDEVIESGKKRNNTTQFAVVIFEVGNYRKFVLAGEDIETRFITSLSAALRKSFPHGDLICHLGNGRFGIIFKPIYSVLMVEDEIQKILMLFSKPWNIQEKDYYTTINIGASVYPGDGDTAYELFKNAISALYYSANLMNESYAFYQNYVNVEADDLTEIKANLRNALTSNSFRLHYQPKIAYQTGHIAGLEALLRWKHPQRGNILPSVFIAAAEESGIMLEINEWTIRECCRQYKQWTEMGIKVPKITVKLSALQISQKGFAERTIGIIRAEGLAPNILGVSVSEGSVTSNAEHIMLELARLRSEGVDVELDNFGMGLGSVNLISELPLDYVKIDRSVVNNIGKEMFSDSVITMIISLAHSKNIKVIGSGIEHRAQMNYLLNHKCDLLQGYMISWPLPADEIEVMLRLKKQFSIKKLSEVI